MMNVFKNLANRIVGRSATSFDGWLRSRSSGRTIGPRPTGAYSEVAAVFACVRARAESVSLMPLVISTANDEVIESGLLAMIAECPNPVQTGRAFFHATEAFLSLHGRAHWVKLLDAGGRPVEVVAISPLLMTEVVDDRTGDLRGWKYRTPRSLAGREDFLPVDQVHTLIEPNFEDASNPYAGLSPRSVVANAIAQAWKADVANEASLDNGVEPGGYYKIDQPITDEQHRELSRQLHESRAGVMHRRRTMLLQGGMDFVANQSTFKDMEFSELKRMTRTDICSAFNVPPSVAGFYENDNRAHAEAADRMFWQNAILPRAAWLAEEFELGVLSHFENDRSLQVGNARRRGVNLRERSAAGYAKSRRRAVRVGRRFHAWFDSSEVPAIQRSRLEQASTAKTWFDMGVPLNQIIAAVDAPFEELAYGDTGYKPIGLEAYGTDLMDTIDDPDGSELETGLLPLEDDEESTDSPRGVRRGMNEGGEGVVKGGEALRGKLWGLWRKSWEPLERVAVKRLEKHFYALRKEVLANFEKAADQIAPPKVAEGESKQITPDTRRDVIGTILFDLVAANGSLTVKVGPIMREAFRLGGEQSMKESADAQGQDESDVFNIKNPVAIEKMRVRDIKLKDVNRTLRNRISRKLAQAIDERQTTQEMAEMLRGEFNFARSRAKTIARTEVGAAVEESRQVGREQAGVPMKSWLSSRAELGRPNHLATEVETMSHPIPNADEFTIVGSGVTCPHPRATGVPGEDINCGCTSLSRYPDDQLKAVMGRYLSRGFLTYGQLLRRDQSSATHTLNEGQHAEHN